MRFWAKLPNTLRFMTHSKAESVTRISMLVEFMVIVKKSLREPYWVGLEYTKQPSFVKTSLDYTVKKSQELSSGNCSV